MTSLDGINGSKNDSKQSDEIQAKVVGVNEIQDLRSHDQTGTVFFSFSYWG